MDRQAFKTDLAAALQRNGTAAELGTVVSKHFPDLNMLRKKDSLLIVSAGTRLVIRPRSARSSGARQRRPNLLNGRGEAERDLDNLIDEIAAFAAVR